ncbi:hypothetical protein KUTeg_003600 [Tegillarca granosa]|uniref:Uncharacterized protein n=1 Tax=Tegillarca granosa TaxID=220873 RepID=A0ABQ9FMK1_TEGGR|nr:hypothetical protein KUTeg_003600 [Tegillarca granosa]
MGALSVILIKGFITNKKGNKTGMTRYVLILSCYGKNSVLYTSKEDKENKVVIFKPSFNVTEQCNICHHNLGGKIFFMGNNHYPMRDLATPILTFTSTCITHCLYGRFNISKKTNNLNVMLPICEITEMCKK